MCQPGHMWAYVYSSQDILCVLKVVDVFPTSSGRFQEPQTSYKGVSELKCCKESHGSVRFCVPLQNLPNIAKKYGFVTLSASSIEKALKMISNEEKKIICFFGSLYQAGNILNKN